MPSGSLQFAAFDSVLIFRIRGRGTAHLGKAFHVSAEAILESDETKQVLLDVSRCEHLDSTCLGGVADLYRRFAASGEPRFLIGGSPEHCRSLFGPTHLDSVLTRTPPAAGEDAQFEELTIPDHPQQSITRHILMCHQRLAEIDGPYQHTFAAIAARLASEMEEE